MYTFADRHQRLYRRHWEAPGDWTRLELSLNCRSTIPIAERVASLFGEPLQARGAAGPAPQFYAIDVHSEGARFVQNFCARLIDDEGIRPDQICVLLNDVRLLTRLRELIAGNAAFVRFGERGIVTETIARYKGLEADVVIVVVTDDLLKDTLATELLYTGISRAKAALFVIGSDAVRRLACWK